MLGGFLAVMWRNMVYTYNIFKFVIGNIYENVSYVNTHFVWLTYSSFLCSHFVAKYLDER